jgi:hypothetical protein
MPLHLITISVGLIIAFGLQQIVELFRNRRRARKAKAAHQAAASPAKSAFPPSMGKPE